MDPMADTAVHSPSPLWAWYAVHTHPRKEGVALENLVRQGFEAYLPQWPVQKVRRGKAVTVVEAMFSRYLFVRLDASGRGQSWSPIRSTLGVRNLVQFGGRPARVGDALVESLRAMERVAQAIPLVAPGDRVVIEQGPFTGLEALVQANDGEHRALILLELLSRPVSLAIDVAHLRRS